MKFRAGRGANDVVDTLARMLALTDEQKSKILPIVVERRQRILEVRTESTLGPRQRKKQVESIPEDSDKRINAQAHDRRLPLHSRVILIKRALDFRIHRQFLRLCRISNLVAEPYRFAMPLDPINDCSLGRTRYSNDLAPRGARRCR